MIGLAVLFLFRLDQPALPVVRPSPAVWLARATFGATWAVLYLGTVVTGSGPHAGDVKAPRNGLDPLQISQLHADLVFLLVGLTRRALVRAAGHARRPGRDPDGRRPCCWSRCCRAWSASCSTSPTCPIVLVGLHMLGAAILSAAVTRLLLLVRA